MTARMPRYDIRNDGAGPYAAFYCDKCNREFRSSPDIGGTVAKDVGRNLVGGLLRNVPLVGAAADRAMGDDQRYTYTLNPQQLQSAWKQVETRFHECPTCRLIVCPSCWDAQSGYCTDDSPRREEIAQAAAEQAAGVLKGIAGAFGLNEVVRGVAESAKAAAAATPRCSQCGKPGMPGAKFCPECGGKMVQPQVATCSKCGAEVHGAKFCPNCGAKVEQAAGPTTCPNCGKETKGAKFCPECGTKVG